MAAICLEKLDAVTEATEHLRAVLDEDAGNEKATLLLSQLLEKTGRDQELADLLLSQIDLAAEQKDVSKELTFRVRLGEVYETRLNDVPKAIETYRTVTERDASHKGALLSLARLFEQRGDKDHAAEVLEKYLGTATGEEAVKTALRLADLYVALKREDDVRRVLELGLEAGEGAATPLTTDIRKRLLGLYEKQKAWTELADLITGDADLATDVAEKVRLYRKAAEIHQGKRSDPAAAAVLLVKASELSPTDRELLLLLCDAYSASGRGRQAAEVLQKIVESYGGRRSKELALSSTGSPRRTSPRARRRRRSSSSTSRSRSIPDRSPSSAISASSRSISRRRATRRTRTPTSTAPRRRSRRCSSRSSTTRRRSPRGRSSTTSPRSATGRATTRRPSRWWSAPSTATRSSRPPSSSSPSSRSNPR